MLEMTLRSGVVLAGAWLLASSMRRGTAATRHLVWHGALITVLLAPAIGPISPKFTLPGVGAVVQEVQEVQEEPTAAMGAAAAPLAPLAPLAPGVASLIGTLGTFVVALWFALGWVVTSARVRKSRPAPLEWQLELNALRERQHVAGEVRVGILAGTGSPFAAGLWRAAILLPESSLQWSAEQRRAVLLHELAHIRRGDCRAQLVTQLACSLYWFNPLMWIAARRIRSERERACDDEVLRAGALPSTYASHLLAVARQVRPALAPSAALAMARPSELEGRLLAVLAEAPARMPLRGSRWAVTAALSALTAFAFGASTAARPQSAASGWVAPDGIRHDSVPHDVISRADRLAARASRARAAVVLQRSPDPEERQQARSRSPRPASPTPSPPCARHWTIPARTSAKKRPWAWRFCLAVKWCPRSSRRSPTPIRRCTRRQLSVSPFAATRAPSIRSSPR